MRPPIPGRSLPDVLRDRKYRELRTGDWVQMADYAPGGPGGEVEGIVSAMQCYVYWWGHAERELADAHDLLVVPRKSP